jgi:hypothetical protein
VSRVIIHGLFEISGKLGDISADVAAIRAQLDEDNGEENEDD